MSDTPSEWMYVAATKIAAAIEEDTGAEVDEYAVAQMIADEQSAFHEYLTEQSLNPLKSNFTLVDDLAADPPKLDMSVLQPKPLPAAPSAPSNMLYNTKTMQWEERDVPS
jgi:hypothetical protein